MQACQGLTNGSHAAASEDARQKVLVEQRLHHALHSTPDRLSPHCKIEKADEIVPKMPYNTGSASGLLQIIIDFDSD